MTEVLASNGRESVRVNAIAPGVTRTEPSTGHCDGFIDADKHVARTPMKRLGKPEEIKAALFRPGGLQLRDRPLPRSRRRVDGLRLRRRVEAELVPREDVAAVLRHDHDLLHANSPSLAVTPGLERDDHAGLEELLVPGDDSRLLVHR